MSDARIPPTAQGVMQIIQNTPVNKIAELDLVKKKYIQNYDACNPGGNGEFMYHRNLVFIKQAISGFKTTIDPFSVYACVTTLAMYGASAAPADEEVYFIPRKGQMCMQFQPGMKVKKLERSKQILSVKKVNLVYKGDTYEVEDGFVKKHVERFESDIIIAGYIKFNLPDGSEKHFSYRPSNWESWRSKSPDKYGTNWCYKSKQSDGTELTQPMPGFLISKIISHACGEKSWTPGRTPATVEVYSNVIISEDEAVERPEYAKITLSDQDIPELTPHEDVVEDSETVAQAETKTPSFLRPNTDNNSTPANTAQPQQDDEPF